MNRTERIEYLLTIHSERDKKIFEQMSDESLESAVVLEKSRIDNELLEAVSEM